jgi:hypothetical protein
LPSSTVRELERHVTTLEGCSSIGIGVSVGASVGVAVSVTSDAGVSVVAAVGVAVGFVVGAAVLVVADAAGMSLWLGSIFPWIVQSVARHSLIL